MSNVTVFCFFASYLLALAFEVVRAVRGLPRLRWLALPAAAAGLLAHTIFLWERGKALNLPPLLSSTQDWLLVVAWVICVLYLFLASYDGKIGVGLFALPLILLFVSVSHFASNMPPEVVRQGRTTEEHLNGWLLLHAALLSLGIAGVVAGVVSSLMYLVQHRRLRHKQARPAGLKLISLERLDRWNRLSVLIAVPLLSLGLAVGFVLFYLAKQQGGVVSLWDPIVIASSIAWLLMIIVLGGTMRIDQASGKAVAVRTLLAFGLLLATLLGLQVATGGGSHAIKGWQQQTSVERPSGTEGTSRR